MKSKLFGKNIAASCDYCNNAVIIEGELSCKKSKQIKNNKCRAFDYNPLLRVPATQPMPKNNFTPEDFML